MTMLGGRVEASDTGASSWVSEAELMVVVLGGSGKEARMGLKATLAPLLAVRLRV